MNFCQKSNYDRSHGEKIADRHSSSIEYKFLKYLCRRRKLDAVIWEKGQFAVASKKKTYVTGAALNAFQFSKPILGTLNEKSFPIAMHPFEKSVTPLHCVCNKLSASRIESVPNYLPYRIIYKYHMLISRRKYLRFFKNKNFKKLCKRIENSIIKTIFQHNT